MRFIFSLTAFFLGVKIFAMTMEPPKGWECIDDQSQLPEKVKLLFVGASDGAFTPSLNVAKEETTMDVSEYVTLAKAYHEGEGDTTCTNLGTLSTKSGVVTLIQIDRSSQWGPVRFLQGMLIKNGFAYVMTATCLQEDFGKYSAQMLKSMQSLEVK